MNSNKKCFSYKSFKSVVQLWYRMCLNLRLLGNIKNLNLKIYKFKISI